MTRQTVSFIVFAIGVLNIVVGLAILVEGNWIGLLNLAAAAAGWIFGSIKNYEQ